MKIQCDVCEKATATVICCADEAALCAKCDVEIHAANKLASKHHRLVLNSTPNKPPTCDICQEKTAFIFCVEDRALFCKDCDKPIHAANTRASKHQRFLATGIRVAGLSSPCTDSDVKINMDPKPPPNTCSLPIGLKDSGISSPSWAVDDLLRFSDFDSPSKKEQLEFNEFEWLSDMNLFGEDNVTDEALAAAEVPQLPLSQISNINSMPSYTSSRYYTSHNKKPRIEAFQEDDDDEFFTVPDLG